MRNTFTIVFAFSIFFILSSCRTNISRTHISPLSQAHAHNDYAHERPLYDALDHGFNSVEADIFLVNDDLFVAHNRQDIAPERTLRHLYLDPLRERVKSNGGRVYPNGPQFTLLIDIKTDAVGTYKMLDKILAEYQDIFTSFGTDGRKNKAVLAIVSGNRPREFMESQKLRYTGCDGRLADLNTKYSADLIPMISDNWGNHFTWKGTGEIPAEERNKLSEIVHKAHEKGRLVRFWATPDSPSPARENLWGELLSAGVDLINTDDLKGLRQFLLANRDI